MVKKHKKLIIILAIFFLSFNIVTDYKQKEAQAVFVIDDVTLVVLGLTVLATGVIAASNSQVKHMGSMVWNRLVDMGVTGLDQISKMDHSKNRNIIMNDLVIDAVTYVAEHLPNVLTKYNTDIELFDSSLNLSVPSNLSYYKDINTFISSSVYSFNLTNVVEILGYDGSTFLDINTITPKSGSGNWISSYTFGTCYVGFYKVNDTLGRISIAIPSIDGSGKSIGYNASRICDFSLKDVSSLKLKFRGAIQDLKHLDNIDYSDSKIKENYNPTVINTNLPWTRGIDDLGNATSIGAIATNSPVVTDLATRDITKDIPLTWNDVKTGFVEKTITNDIVTDKVTDGTVTDGTGTGTIDKVVDKVFSPTTTKSLDFSPLQLSLADKFPFCIPFDFIRVFNIFTSNAVTPNFIITMPENLVGGGSSFEFNFDKFEKLASILRFFVLLFFITNLIKYTRDLISH